MAINTIELVKNKNYGFQLTAPDLFVDILTLDLVSGDCTSTYFDSPELAQFKRTALELFTIVAPAERAPGALNLLNRIVAVAAADDATVTRSVNIVGNLATLRITVDANPGSFVAHVPFSGDGAIAWAGGNDAGGGGGGVTAVNGLFPITSSGGATPDIGITLDTAVTDSLEALPSGLAVNFDPDAGLQSTVGNGLQIKPGLTQGVAFNVSGEVVVKADPNYYDFSFGPGDLTPLDTGVVAGTYGDASNVAQVQVDAKGRVLNVVNVPISGGGTVTAVTGTAPILSSGGATPDISLSPGTSSGDLLTWNGVAWVAAAPPAGVSAFLLNDVFVSMNGSDVTGDGSATKPFATVGAAMASITLATSNNRYAIRLAAGAYTEGAPLALKPDVFVVGEGWENTSLNAVVVLDPSFSTAVDPFSGFYDLAIEQTVTVDMAAVTNATARFNSVNTRYNDDLTITAFSNSNIFGIVRSVTGGGVVATFNGGDFFSFGTLFQGPVNIGESVAAQTYFTSNSDTFNGAVTATNAGGTAAGDFVVVVMGSSMGYQPGNPNARESFTASGDVILKATSNFVPDSANLNLSGGATLEQWSFAPGVGYEPTTPGDWLTPPTEVSGALDELASRISGAGTVTAVTASSPLASSGGATPDISLTASGVVAGTYGSATSVPVFDVTAEGLITIVTDTAISFPVTAVTATGPLSSSGGATPDISLTGIVPVANGGTNASSFNANGVVVADATGTTLVDVLGSSSGDVLTWNGTAWVSAAVPTGGLVNWTENTTTYSGQVINDFTVLNAATNVDAALVAKGTGATVADIADGTAAGGDNRGTYATDWQKTRAAASQVASGGASVIGGGANNTASVQGATVAGGESNNAAGIYGTIGGGRSNTAGQQYVTVAGGQNNSGTGLHAAIGGGFGNNSASPLTVIGGGNLNAIGGTADGATIGGGSQNQVLSALSTISGGGSNTVEATGTSNYSAIGGGQSNTVQSSSNTTTHAFIGGGQGNVARRPHASVLGGTGNTASQTAATVGGGGSNQATGVSSAVLGGFGNIASGTLSVSVGGTTNSATAESSTVGGGANNTASAQWATVAGGRLNNVSGEAGFAAGLNNAVSGANAVGIGATNIASGANGVAIGIQCEATQTGNVAIGYLSKATGNNTATAISGGTASADSAVAIRGTASGNWSTAVGGIGNSATNTGASVFAGQNNVAAGSWAGILSGRSNVAPSAYEVGLGFQSHNFAGDAANYVATDVAVGYGNGGTGNAFTFLKDGSLALGKGTAKPADKLDVVGNARMTGAIVQDGFTSGAAITAGEVCYLAADGKVYPAQANAAATSSVVGIAVETVVAADLTIALATFNKTGGFSGLTTGTEYFLSATVAGAVVDYATLSATSGAEIVSLGYARSATEIQLSIQRRGVTP